LGYTTEGKYRGRIIVPSFDENNEINYFVSRSYVGHKNKYKNPEAEKDKIIFNEHLINWEKDIYLVEGVFDMFFIDNSIPLLGKSVSDKLWGKLYDNSKKNIIICLDGDAWEDAKKLYRKLEGGRLNGRIKLLKVPKDKDVGELGGIKGLKEITLL
jgi:DNA primase